MNLCHRLRAKLEREKRTLDVYGFYPGLIAHMVNLAHLDDTRAAIIDNNRPGQWVWMTRGEFLDRWKWNQGGWAVVFLDPPPPPYAAKPVAAGMAEVKEAGGKLFFGVDPEKVQTDKRWWLNAKPSQREAVLRAVGSGGLVDDSSRGWIVAVGDDQFRAKVVGAVGELPRATRQRFHLQTYAPDHWAVTQYALKPGVTIRSPATARVGATVGTIAAEKFAGVADLVAVIDPPPAPQPAPAPAPQPAPARNWLPVAFAAALAWFLGRQSPR